MVPAGTAGQRLASAVWCDGQALNVILLVALVLILMNLEQTFRSAVGTMRWRIKFVVLALVVIFGARLYVRSQAILFSAPDIALWGVESGALLIGCVFLALAYARTGWAEIDVYPSSAVLRSSLTVLIVGGYLFVVGVLAQVVRRFGGAELFQFQAFVVLLGMAGLAVLLLSDRARQTIHAFVVRHFRKAQHDSVQDLDAVLAAAGQRDRSGRPVRGVREIDLRNLRRAVGHRLAARRGEGTARRRRLDRGDSRARPAATIRPTSRRAPSPPDCEARSSPFDLEERERAVGGGIAAAQFERRSRTAATVCAFPCAPENRASASSCWPIASTARPTRSRNWNC